MKRFYCQTCKRFKRRYEVKSEMVGYQTYWFFCKWCHKSVMYSEDALEKTLALADMGKEAE